MSLMLRRHTAISQLPHTLSWQSRLKPNLTLEQIISIAVHVQHAAAGMLTLSDDTGVGSLLMCCP